MSLWLAAFLVQAVSSLRVYVWWKGRSEVPWVLATASTSVHCYESGAHRARVEKLVAARCSGPDHHSSSDIATLTQQFLCMILPTKKAIDRSRHFHEERPDSRPDRIKQLFLVYIFVWSGWYWQRAPLRQDVWEENWGERVWRCFLRIWREDDIFTKELRSYNNAATRSTAQFSRQ